MAAQGDASPRGKPSLPRPKRILSRLQKAMEREDMRSHDQARGIPLLVIGLAVATLSLGLAMLAVVTKLDVNKVDDVPPHLAMSSDASEGELQILQAEPGLRWSDLKLDGDCSPLLNGAPLSETPTAQVRAGDVLSCPSGATLQIFSPRDRGDAILHETKFGS